MIKEFNVGVKGVVRVKDKCLILKNVKDGNSYWDIPGGRIDDNETIEETLKRELSEELPTLGKYSIGNILNAYRLSHDLKDNKALLLIFYKIEAEEFEVKLSSEHTEFKWVSKNELPALLAATEIPIEKGYYEAIEKALN
ncbi:MAG: NUDIX hydrolase [Candidatus Paceibacterota bacterium]